MQPAAQKTSEIRGYWLLIATAMVLGAGLRLVPAPHFDFYGDEFWTIQWIQASVGEILSYFGRGLTMHLYILFIKAWTSLMGISPFMVKLPSLIAGVALIPSVFWLGRKWLNPDAAALAAVMIAINYQMILHSRTARVYAILAVAVVLSMLLFVRALRTGSRRDLLVASLVNACLLTLSVHSIYVLIVQGAFLGLETISRRLPLRRLIAFAVGGVLSLGLATLFYLGSLGGLGELAGTAGVTSAPQKVYWPWLPDQKLWVPFNANHSIAPWVMLAGLGLGSWIAWWQHPRTGRLLVLWATLPSLLYFLQRSPLPGSGIARYVLPALPAQFLLIALAAVFILHRLTPDSKRTWALGLIILLVTITTLRNQRYWRDLISQPEPTQQAIFRILEVVRPGDLVTSFPQHYHEFFKLHVGVAAAKLPALVRNPALSRPGRLILLMHAQPNAIPWWRDYFEIEAISGPRYRQRLHLLTSKTTPAGPSALQVPIEHFYYGLLYQAANGKRLHHRPGNHYKYLSLIHLRLSRLAKKSRAFKEFKEHLRLKNNPRAWNGHMTEYPAIMARLRPPLESSAAGSWPIPRVPYARPPPTSPGREPRPRPRPRRWRRPGRLATLTSAPSRAGSPSSLPPSIPRSRRGSEGPSATRGWHRALGSSG